MGTVHLTNGHHGLYIHHSGRVNMEERVLLTPELLARPIFALDRPIVGQTLGVHRAALQGLMDLGNFDAAVSFRVELRDGVECLALPKRVWGEITLDSPRNVIARFSHDSRYENRPFSFLLQWLEERYPDQLDDEGFDRLCEEMSSAEKWREFFKLRITLKIMSLRAKSDELHRESQDVGRRAAAIATALVN